MILDFSLSFFILLSDKEISGSVQWLVSLGSQGCLLAGLPPWLLCYKEQHRCAISITPAAARGETPDSWPMKSPDVNCQSTNRLHLWAKKMRFHCSYNRADIMFETKLPLNKFLKFIWSWESPRQANIIIMKVIVTINGTLLVYW